MLFRSIQCRQEVDIGAVEREHGIDFASYFAPELERLERFVADGMVAREGRSFRLTALGRFFTPHVCRVFDAFLAADPNYKIHGP